MPIANSVHPTRKVREVTLPSGAIATIRRAKGRDLLNARRALREGRHPIEGHAVLVAIACETSEIGGRPLTLDDALEMDVRDVWRLQAEMGENFPA